MKADTLIGAGVGFERTLRVTGYLSNDARINKGKRCEIVNRVMHSFNKTYKSTLR